MNEFNKICLPKAALAALVISAVMLLFNPKEVFVLWKANRHDGIVAVTVFVIALIAKPDYALLIGVMISLMFFLWKTMHPRIVRVTKDPELNMFLNADIHEKPSCPQILHLRSDNAIYFANAEYTIEHLIERLDEQTTPIKFLLIDFQAVGFIDAADFEDIERQGDTAIRHWIDDQLEGTTVTVVLVGEKTCDSRWVKYEIAQSIEKGNGLLGIDISKISDLQGNTTERCGRIPLGYNFYLWNNDDGYHKMGDWIEAAARVAGR